MSGDYAESRKINRWTFFSARAFGALIGSLLLVTSFQNCSQGGFSSGDESSVSGVNSKFKAGPLPVEMSFNQIAYMSCPGVPTNPVEADPLQNPYFTLRAGAYDNSNMISFSGPVGGIGISKESLAYVKKSISEAATPQSLGYFVRASPYTNNTIPVATMLLRARSKEKGSDYMWSAPFLDILSNQLISNQIGAAPVREDGSLDKINFFSQAAYQRRSFMVSLNATNTREVETVRGALRSNTYLMLGLVDSSKASKTSSVIPNLVSPDADFTRRLFGRGYNLFFDNDSRDPSICDGVPCLIDNSLGTGKSAVTELDFNPSSVSTSTAVDPIDLTTKEKQAWGCINLRVVRSIDRTFRKAVVAGVIPNSNITANPGDILPQHIRPANAEEYFFTDQAEVTSVENTSAQKYGSLFVFGRYAACPPQKVEELDVKDASGMHQRDLLRIVRRFLPADHFEVNLAQRCIVPKSRTMASAHQCYASKDDNRGTYVRYRLSGGATCGPNNDECAASVSICYRKK